MFNVCLSAIVRIIVPGVLTYGAVLKKTLVSFYHYTELSIFPGILLIFYMLLFLK